MTGDFLQVPVLIGSTQNEADIIVVAAQMAAGIVVEKLGYILSDMLTLVAFTCSVRTTASHRVNAGVPTWRYKYQAVFPNISLRPDLRAFHGSQLPIVFGTYSGANSTQTQQSLSRFVQRAWVAFTRDPEFGLNLLQFGWPRLAEMGGPHKPTGIKLAREPPAVGAMCKLIEGAMVGIGDVLNDGLEVNAEIKAKFGVAS
ncbi:hypothetical protein H0H93_016633, partial [Arthromyces matolae]